MKITIVTPLYPPEIAEPALYTKELAKRLSLEHELTIIAYANLPEKLSGVRIVAVNKNTPLPIRLIQLTASLLKNSSKTDVIFMQNGPSVELPTLISAIITKKPIIMHIIDKPAHQRTMTNIFFAFVEKILKKISYTTITTDPIKKPEILPFEDYPNDKFKLYEESWNKHLIIINNAFKNATGN